MEPFGDHLCADEDIGFARAKLFEEAIVTSFVSRGVGVHAQSTDVGKDRVKSSLDHFGAGAFEFELSFLMAIGAGAGWCETVVAEVAGEEVIAEVVGEADIAVGALHGVGTEGALLCGMVAASVEEEKSLLAQFDPFFDGA